MLRGLVSSINAAISGLSSNGLIARTAAGTVAARTITGTTGELALTNGNGVSGNPTLNLTNGPKLLFRLTGADMASQDADQAFTKIGSFTTYAISEVVAARLTGAYSVACVGGIYTAATKGGSALIGAAQSYAALTGAATISKLTLAAILATGSYTATPILNLSVANAIALTADMFIYGYVLD